MNSLTEKSISYCDYITAFLLVLLVLFLSLNCISNDCYWGDDYAAYISEGIAISEGRLDEECRLNTIMHPSPLPDEASGQSLVYVWGYPLILSIVYNFVGFDRVLYNTIFFYKLPSLAAFALVTVVFFFFLRRRFSYRLSLLLTALFCTCVDFYDFLNTIYSDLVFLFLAMLSLFLEEVFLECSEKRRKIFFGILLGVSLWYMYEVRLNGIAILLCCIIRHIVHSIYEKSYREPTKFFAGLLPYLLFVVLKIVSEKLIAAPTSNMSDAEGCTFTLFCTNLYIYYQLFSDWIASLWYSFLINPLYSLLRRFSDIGFEDFSLLRSICIIISYAFFILGLVTADKKRNLHLLLFVFAYIAAAAMLPYTQGLRYVYPLLPVILLFIGYGTAWIYGRVIKTHSLPVLRCLTTGVTVLLCFLCIYSSYSNNSKGLRETAIVNVEDIYMQNAYSDLAIETYNYICSSTPEDCTIAFFAPRGLYLNTNRLSIRPGVNGHSIEEADYFLEYLKTGEFSLYQENENGYELIFSNEEFKFYKLDK